MNDVFLPKVLGCILCESLKGQGGTLLYMDIKKLYIWLKVNATFQKNSHGRTETSISRKRSEEANNLLK